jgi:uncharacterized protein YaaQ
MNKKMILSVVEDSDSTSVLTSMHDAGFPVTRIDSSGTLLRSGTSTLITAVDAADVDGVIKLINQDCSPRANPFKKRTTIMVFDLEHFEQIP